MADFIPVRKVTAGDVAKTFIPVKKVEVEEFIPVRKVKSLPKKITSLVDEPIGKTLYGISPSEFVESLPKKITSLVTQPLGKTLFGESPSEFLERKFKKVVPEKITPRWWIGETTRKVTGLAADILTTPSTYLLPPALKGVAKIKPVQMFIRSQLPTLGKGLIQPITPDEWAYQNWLKNPAISPSAEDLIRKQVSQEATGKMAGSLNVTKFPEGMTPILRETVEKFAQEIEAQRRGVLTFSMIREKAEALRGKINIMALRPGDIVNAETNLAARMQVVDKATEAAKTGSKKLLQEAYDEIIRLQGLSTEISRALTAHRIPIMSEFAKGKDFLSTITEGLKDITPEDTETIRKFFKVATNPTFWDKFIEYRTAGMLTSPYTHERNIIGNLIGRLTKLPERIVLGGVNSIRSQLTNTPRERYATEAIADTIGMVRGFKPALRNAFNALINENFTFSSRFAETQRYGKAIGGTLGKAIRMPFRFLNAMDEFFMGLNTSSSLYAQAYRQAMKEGSKDIISRTAELIKQPTVEMLAKAQEEALIETFRQPLTGIFAKLLPAQRTSLGRFITPFFRTPINLFKWSFDRSPFAIFKFASPKFWQLPAEKLDEEIAKIAFGQMINLGIAKLAWEGKITGNLSNNKAKREAKMRQGIMPYSFVIGGKYTSYKNNQPLSTNIALIANMVEQYKENEKIPLPEFLIKIAFETAKFMREQSFLIGVKNLFDAMDDPERYGKTFIQNLVTSSTIPTGVSYLARLLDPVYRETATILDAIKAKIPGVSKTLPPKLDVWGRPISQEGTLIERAINPSGIVTYKPDLTEEELLSLEKFPVKIAKEYRELPLTIDERNIITRVEGDLMKRLLDKLIATPEYQRLDTLEREKIIDKVISEVKTKVRRIFLNQKIMKDLQGFESREKKIAYIEKLIDAKIIKVPRE